MGIFRQRPSNAPATAGSSVGAATYPLNMSEASWRDEQLVRACDLVCYYTDEDTDQPTLEQLDATVMAWAADTSDDCPEVGDIDNALGIAFGDILAEDAHLSWVVAGGSQDSDLAVHTADDDVVVFPRAIVAEYLDTGPSEPFFVRLHGELTASLGCSPDSR